MKRTIIKYLLSIILTSIINPLAGQSLTQEQLRFLEKNSKVICESDSSEPSWDALMEQVKDKQFILLGEFTHGGKEIFKLRTSLIKYLHEKLGINVILFESGMGELISADINKQNLSPVQMINGLFSGWRTKEFADLMEYVKAKNMSVAGFDVQRTGGSFQFILKEIATKKKIDSIHYYNLEQRYGVLVRELTHKKANYDSLGSKTKKLIDDYDFMKSSLMRHRTKDNSKELLLSIATLQNRIRYLSYMLAFVKDKDYHKRWAARDSAMATNIHWLKTIYKGERMLIIGHNFHIARYNEQEAVMGEMLNAAYGKRMYSLGVLAANGSYYDNGAVENQLLPPDSTALDIKHMILAQKGEVNYVHIPTTVSPGNEWLHANIIVNDTFIDLNNSNTLKLSKSFDGLLLLKKVSPPKE